MSKLVFEAAKNEIFDASVYTLGSNQIRIVFANAADVPGNDVIYSGFVTVNEYNHMVEASYKDYIYKYRDIEDSRTFDLDNNNVPYVPPTPVPPVPPTPPEPPVPPTLAEVLANKIAELSAACKTEIEDGVTISFDGNIEHFAYSLSGGDQNNIDDLFNTMIQTLSGQYYHADGGSCKLYTPAEIFYIYFFNKAQTQSAVTYYNQITIWLNDVFGDAEDTEANRKAVEDVAWRVTPLVGKYLELYEAVLTQGQSQMEMFKSGLESKGVDFSEDIELVEVNTTDDVVDDESTDEEESPSMFDELVEAANASEEEPEDVVDDSEEEESAEEIEG